MTKAKVTVTGAKIKGVKKVQVMKAVMPVRKVKIAVTAAKKARKVKAAVIEVMREVTVEETAVITAERETMEKEKVQKAVMIATAAVEGNKNDGEI